MFAPEEWKVISTCRQVGGPDKTKIVLGSPVFRLDGDILKEFTDSFKGATFYAVEFAKTEPISTYIYSMVAGPYDEIKPLKDDPELRDVPLRLFCRSSLTMYVNDIAEDWFRVTR